MSAASLPFGTTAADFRWCTGIEDTFVPQHRPGQRPLDEYALMGHYERWRDDLGLAQASGARMIRWGIPWYRVEPAPGVFDWSWTDQVIPYIVDELGLELIVDLMHYGTPDWLAHSFASPGYPAAVAAYARAVAERYGDRIRYWTPLNEPVVNAMMCGERGIWPPYLRGDRGWIKVAVQLAAGIIHTVAAIRELQPEAVMVHVEATGLVRAARPELEPLAAEARQRDWLILDLITGQVDAAHPMWPWLVRGGASLHALAWLQERAIGLDVLGLNFYPQWSTRELTLDRRGRMVSRVTERDGAGFAELIRSYQTRYGAPVMITETSAKEGLAPKQRWLADSVAAIRELRAEGVPVLGYTWFPLFTMVDWRYRTGRGPRDEYLIELGLYESEGAGDELRYVATPVLEQFRALTLAPDIAVGDLRRR